MYRPVFTIFSIYPLMNNDGATNAVYSILDKNQNPSISRRIILYFAELDTVLLSLIPGLLANRVLIKAAPPLSPAGRAFIVYEEGNIFLEFRISE